DERRCDGPIEDLVVLPEPVGIGRLVPLRVALDGTGVGVDEQLGWVAAQSLRGFPGPVNAVAIALAGVDPRQVAVPDVAGALREWKPLLVAGAVEEAELDLGGHLREEGEVGAGPVVGCAEGIGFSGPDLHPGRVGTAGALRNPASAQALAAPRCFRASLDLSARGTTRTVSRTAPTATSIHRTSWAS